MTKLRELRLGRGIKLMDLSREIRMDPSHFHTLECGLSEASGRVRDALSAYLGVEPHELFNDDGFAL